MCLPVHSDMTPESRIIPLLANGSLRYLSAATNKRENNGGNVRHGDLYSILPEVVKNLVRSLFAREPSFENSVQFKKVNYSAVREFRILVFSCGVLTS